ncbi:MAG: hypothetical protein K0S01_2772 [Herbinix sp.]|jgi:hypothetical protein|nr:hypothetical protein [Herbinix sp.]
MANEITLSRNQLYDEVWKISVQGVAKKYNLHYQQLLNSCKEANIPIPPSGYWTRLKCGKDVSQEVTELPQSDIENVTLYLYGLKPEKNKKEKTKPSEAEEIEVRGCDEGINSGKNDFVLQEDVIISVVEDSPFLLFLEEDERKKVLNMVSSIKIRDGKKLHPKVIQYRDSIDNWNKQQMELKKNPYYRPRYNNNNTQQPIFMNEVAPSTLTRIYKILDAMFTAVEALGGKINSDLSMMIHKDTVRVRFAEAQDKLSHELSKQEARELVEYNDKVKQNKWASKPNIRKYDYVYNGRLRIVFSDQKYIRDNESEKIEDKLGDILIKLYEISEDERIERERREEIQRQQREEERKKEERRKLKNQEIQMTRALVNQAQDYKISCEIRQYITAVEEKSDGSEEVYKWIEWAKQKANWYDPTLNYEDDILGKRDHSKEKDEKSKLLEVRDNYNRGFGF